MIKLNFTPEQNRAIDYNAPRSASVSASAGSGKTAVLVEHIAKLISDSENKTPADRLAAVTFTERAAAELKQRLSQRVEELLRDKPDSAFLREQLVRLSSARISTISSFCLSLIRDNIRLLPDIDEGFGICDETKAKILSEKALEKCFETIYTSFPPDKREELSRRLGGKNEISYSVKRLSAFLSNIPDPDKWKENQDTVFESPDKYFDAFVKKYVRYIGERLAEISEMCVNAEKELPDGSKTSENFRSYFEFHKSHADAARAAAVVSDYKTAYLEMKEEYSGTAPAARGKAFEGLGFKEKRDEIKELYIGCGNDLALAANYEKDCSDIKKAFELLWEIKELYENEYGRLKRAEGVLDFSDLERCALKVVRQDGGKGQFDHIIVDEFQDSNDIQYEIFRGLSKEESNLYFVGDVKQCIYAYRSANPDIFASLRNKPQYEDLRLNANFRSGESVLNAVNSLFGGSRLPESFSGGSEWENMSAGRGIKAEARCTAEFVTVNVLRSAAKSGDEKQKNREERYVASRILQMVKEGFTVHDKQNRERKCGFGDFAVLLRTNGDCARFGKIFEEYGIPCVSEGEKHFTDLIEIDIALSLVSAALRPNNDAETAKALMSPVYGFTAEDMAKLKLSNKAGGSLYSGISALTRSENKELGEKAAAFDKDMKLFRKAASNSVTYDLLQTIYETTLLPQIMRAGRSGREREENLKLLLHYAKSSPRPADFLSLMKHISRSKLEMSQASVKEREESSVKIMTIHKSKGLQFPVVFVSDINKRPNVTDTYKDFIFDAKKGLGALVCDYKRGIRANTASHRVLEENYTDRLRGESMRLFYVALTRAEEKLIITASNKLSEKSGKSKAADENAVDEYAYNPESKENYFAFVVNGLSAAGESIVPIRIRTDEDIFTKAAEEALSIPKRTAPPLDLESVKRNLSYVYPYEKAVHTPAKFTATALGVAPAEGGSTDGGDSVSSAFYMGMPLFMKDGKSLSGKELGDIYHCVMEHIDFSAVSAEEELERIFKEGFITVKEKNAVKVSEIQSFLNSGLCGRLRKARNVTREFKIFTTVNGTGAENPENEDLSFIQGIADMFFEEADGVVLTDYKTNKNITEEKLINEYKGQLSLYKKALEEMLGKKVKECLLYSFWLGREIEVWC
ncbi:MAG: UvrD-helicase domain-containing protein [Bacteroides sp.]|nr:UvrD-helicase domain-containing protein [Bacteroides sp.]